MTLHSRQEFIRRELSLIAAFQPATDHPEPLLALDPAGQPPVPARAVGRRENCASRRC